MIRGAVAERDPITLAIGVLLGFVPLLVVVPYWFATNPDVASAAAARGYNASAAYLMTLLWAALSMGGIALLPSLRGSRMVRAPAVARIHRSEWRVPWKEIFVILSAITVVYFPLFLARSGPFVEDGFFLSMVQRMQGGQKPFVDFELLYGPAMIYPAHLWSRLFGFSLRSYYAYLVLLETLSFSALWLVLRHYLPNPRARLTALVLLGIFFVNTLMGPNQNGVRKLLPVLGLLLLAGNPASLPKLAGVGAILGFQLSYSQEYGLAGLVAGLALLLFLAVRERRGIYLSRALLLTGVAAVTWLSVAGLLMGHDFATYLRETLYLTRRMAAGQSAFPFSWTLNSLVAFGLLSLACVVVGRGLSLRDPRALTPGDRLLFVGLVYALIALKSGLSRSDLWHVNPPFLALLFAWILPLDRSVFAASDRVRNLGLWLIAGMAGTYALGLAPTASFDVKGWLNGLEGTLHPEPPVRIQVRYPPALELERRFPRDKAVRLAAYLAAPERRGADVLFYEDTWGLDKQIGVYKRYYSNDSFLHSEARGIELREFLKARPEALVVMRRSVYERLFGLADPNAFPEVEVRYAPTLLKRLAGRLSSVHFRNIALERAVKEARWARTVGVYIRSGYEPRAEFGDLLVLGRRRK